MSEIDDLPHDECYKKYKQDLRNARESAKQHSRIFVEFFHAQANKKYGYFKALINRKARKWFAVKMLPLGEIEYVCSLKRNDKVWLNGIDTSFLVKDQEFDIDDMLSIDDIQPTEKQIDVQIKGRSWFCLWILFILFPDCVCLALFILT